MFDSLKRLQLQRKGLSCGRTRRKSSDSEVLEMLRYSPYVRGAILAAFVFSVIGLLGFPPVEGALFDDRPLLCALVVVTTFGVALLHFFANHPVSFRRNSRVVLIFGLILLQLAVVKAAWLLAASGPLWEKGVFLVIPYALVPMTLSIMLGRAHGIFAAVFGSLWAGMLVPADYVFPFVVTSIVCGFVGVYVTNQIRRRSRLLRAGIYVGAAALVMVAVFGFLHLPEAGGEATTDQWRLLAFEIIGVLLVGVFSAMVLGGSLPLLESLFHVTTDISWIELADLNHPLLKRLTLEAPGTYHHSLVVANLSEAAAEAIGANPTMCRVCSYFHDIGKLAKPEYYIENISDAGNPHDDLTPTMSALVIIAHVKDGVDLAIKHKLNPEIINIIEQHHGTSLIYYFYRRALDQQDEIKRRVEEGNAHPEDVPSFDEKSFRYPGPKPQYKESAIISLADAVESASRSLAKPTPQKIEQLIEEIVQGRFRDGQLDECDLTFRELEFIKKSFSSTLRSMLHSRISYPKQNPVPEPLTDSRAMERTHHGTRTRGDTQRLRPEAAKSAQEPPKPAVGSGV